MEIKAVKRPTDPQVAGIEADFAALPLPSRYHYDALNGTLGTIETDKAIGFRCPMADGSKKLGVLWFPKSKLRTMDNGSYCVQTTALNDAYGRRPDLLFPEIAPGLRLLSI